jgi:ubiquinone/menaquinone biosynthesis C-methylase UbiE
MTTIIECPPSSSGTRRTLALQGVKAKQQAMWASGDFSVIGTTLQGVGESLCEAVDLRAGQRVLDAACGNGNAVLAAARRWGRVTGVDYVPELLLRAEERARAERLEVELTVADVEQLPFRDGAFDVVLSTFGVMFAPNHAQAAGELLRVCAPGGRIALANWTPEGFIGELLRAVTKHVPPAPGAQSPLRWGTRAGLEELFGAQATAIHVERKLFNFRYLSAEHFIDVFRRYYGPTYKAFESLDAYAQTLLADDIEKAIEKFDRGGGWGLVVPGEYLEVVIHKA